LPLGPQVLGLDGRSRRHALRLRGRQELRPFLARMECSPSSVHLGADPFPARSIAEAVSGVSHGDMPPICPPPPPPLRRFALLRRGPRPAAPRTLSVLVKGDDVGWRARPLPRIPWCLSRPAGSGAAAPCKFSSLGAW